MTGSLRHIAHTHNESIATFNAAAQTINVTYACEGIPAVYMYHMKPTASIICTQTARYSQTIYRYRSQIKEAAEPKVKQKV